MKLLQYNIVLPVTLDELRLIENYIPLMLKLNILKNENENINFIQSKDFSNEEYVIIYLYNLKAFLLFFIFFRQTQL